MEQRKTTWIVLALIALNIAVYASVGRHDFVDYDDDEYVTKNLHVNTGWTAVNVEWAFTSVHASNWHPLTWLSHMADVQLFGLRAGRHHFTNVLFHTLNAVLLFAFLRRSTGAPLRSAFVAALFAVHPLHVESVAWIAERKDVLGAFFGMLMLVAYGAYVRQPSRCRYLLVAVCLCGGLMSKPVLVTFPAALLLLDIWPFNRVTRGAGFGFLVLEKLPLLTLSIISSIVTFIAQRQSGAVIGIDRFPVTFRILNAAHSYVMYIRDLVWPTKLAVFYPIYSPLPLSWSVSAAVFLTAVSLAAILTIRRNPYLFTGWFWYLGTLVPMIGLIQVGEQARADRYTYIPLIGVFIVISWAAGDLIESWRGLKVPAMVIAVGVLIGCAALTRSQLQHWQNSYTLWTRALSVTAGNYVAHNNLGLTFAAERRDEEAEQHLRESLRIKPNQVQARNNLGMLFARHNRLHEAILEFSRAVTADQNFAEAHYNLGTTWAMLRKQEEAIHELLVATRLDPANPDAHHNLGFAFLEQHRVQDAAFHFSEAVRLQPTSHTAHFGLALALEGLGRVDAAIAECEASLRIRPDFEDALRKLGDLRQRRS